LGIASPFNSPLPNGSALVGTIEIGKLATRYGESVQRNTKGMGLKADLADQYAVREANFQGAPGAKASCPIVGDHILNVAKPANC
jgi:alkyl hydroperoxide reductase subunit AhpC